MARPAAILFVTEGAKTEPAFFKRIATVYQLNAEIVSVRANIYALYEKMKSADFQLDILGALKEMNLSSTDRAKLERNFTYTYLVFDLDAQHGSEKNRTADIRSVVSANLKKLPELAEHFTDETDPTIGRLYINYPMMESYRDANTFFDDTFATRSVSLGDLHSYKSEVGKRHLCRYHTDDYTEANFSSLAKMNVFKLNTFYGAWKAMSYADFRARSECTSILSKETRHILEQGKIPVLNTSLFFILDYFGNKEGFYNRIILN